MRLVGFDENAPEIQSLFQEIKVCFLSQLNSSKQNVEYLAFSLLPLNQEEIENILSDHDCKGLCIMIQSQKEFQNILVSSKYTKNSFLKKIFKRVKD